MKRVLLAAILLLSSFVLGQSSGRLAGGGGGTPGGSNTQFQYNNSGAFGGTSGLTWNSANGLMALTAGAATGTNNIVTIGDTLNNTGTGFMFYAPLAAGSAGNAFKCSRGAGGTGTRCLSVVDNGVETASITFTGVLTFVSANFSTIGADTITTSTGTGFLGKPVAIASLPSAASNTDEVIMVNDALSPMSCKLGGGLFRIQCASDGTKWNSLGFPLGGSSASTPHWLTLVYDGIVTTPYCTNCTSVPASSSSAAIVATATENPGVAYTSGAVATNVAVQSIGHSMLVATGGSTIAASRDWYAHFRVSQPGGSAQAALRMCIAITDQVSATQCGADAPGSGNYAEFRWTTGNSNWACVVNNGGASPTTQTNCGIQMDANAHDFEIFIDEHAQTVSLYIDGVLGKTFVSSDSIPMGKTLTKLQATVMNTNVTAQTINVYKIAATARAHN